MIGLLLSRDCQVPAGDDWLTPSERQWFSDRRSAKRVADWRLGRWTAKAAVTAFLLRRSQPIPAELEVLAGDDGAPDAYAAGRPLPVALSISHSHGRAVAVVAAAGTDLGCDLERIAPRSAGFVSSYLTRRERDALAATDDVQRHVLATLIWSAKESALKALRQGLRADTRSLEVRLSGRPNPTWNGLEVACGSSAQVLAGRWTRLEAFLLTVVSRPPPGEIVDLGQPELLTDRRSETP